MKIIKKVEDVFGYLYKPDQKPVSVKEMNDAIKRRFRKKFK
jgi:hypothetical protein